MRRMETSAAWFVSACVLALAIMASASRAQAEDVQLTGPLANAPACRHCRLYRQGRVQLQPFVGFTLQDEFSRTIFTGLQVNYHLFDWLGLGVWGGFGAIHLDTALTDEVSSEGESTERNRLSFPSRNGFSDQIGEIQWMVAPQVTFSPLRGKLGLFQQIFADTDFYLFGGVAFVGVSERADVSDPNVCAGETVSDACLATQSDQASRVAIAPTFGAGLTVMIQEWFGLAFEWRAFPFAWNTSGTDEAGSRGLFPDGVISDDDQIFHFNHMVNVGFTFYLPTSAGIGE